MAGLILSMPAVLPDRDGLDRVLFRPCAAGRLDRAPRHGLARCLLFPAQRDLFVLVGLPVILSVALIGVDFPSTSVQADQLFVFGCRGWHPHVVCTSGRVGQGDRAPPTTLIWLRCAGINTDG